MIYVLDTTQTSNIRTVSRYNNGFVDDDECDIRGVTFRTTFYQAAIRPKVQNLNIFIYTAAYRKPLGTLIIILVGHSVYTQYTRLFTADIHLIRSNYRRTYLDCFVRSCFFPPDIFQRAQSRAHRYLRHQLTD